MYIKPRLEKFGTFRELTQLGLYGAADGGSAFGITAPVCAAECDYQPSTS